MELKPMHSLARIVSLVLPLVAATSLLVLVLTVAAAPRPGSLTRLTYSSPQGQHSVGHDISADGRVIAINSDSDFFGQGIGNDDFEIWLYDTNAMTLTRITYASHPYRQAYGVDLSADGTVIAFYGDSDYLGQGLPAGQDEVWLYDTAMMTYTRVTSASHSDRRSINPSLSSHGSLVAFESDSDFLGEGIVQGQDEIWLYNTETMTLTRLTWASDPDRSSWNPQVSDDGSVVAFESNSDLLGQGPVARFEVWLYDTQAMTLTRVTWASADNRVSCCASLSADGTVLAFESDGDFLGQGLPEGPIEIWLYDTKTLTFTHVTPGCQEGHYTSDPDLSADGTVVAFRSDCDLLGEGRPPGQREIWLYDTNAMTYTCLTTASESNRLSMTPRINGDGRAVVFRGDSDFLGQGIPRGQYETWLWRGVAVYIPLVLRG